jgi:hypothetical protein
MKEHKRIFKLIFYSIIIIVLLPFFPNEFGSSVVERIAQRTTGTHLLLNESNRYRI